MSEAPGSLARDHLRAYIERIERLEQEKASLMEDIREIYAEAKATGFGINRPRPNLRRQLSARLSGI